MLIELDRMQRTPGLTGDRYAFWSHGCRRSCPGCIASLWNGQRAGYSLSTSTIANTVLSSGVTEMMISGGEPLLQADGWLKAVRTVRRLDRDKKIGVVIYTGYLYDDVMSGSSGKTAADLLTAADAVVDGPYVREMDCGEGWRGSENQRLVLHGDRFVRGDFERMKRVKDIDYDGYELFLSAIPTGSAVQTFYKAVDYFCDTSADKSKGG